MQRLTNHSILKKGNGFKNEFFNKGIETMQTNKILIFSKAKPTGGVKTCKKSPLNY